MSLPRSPHRQKSYPKKTHRAALPLNQMLKETDQSLFETETAIWEEIDS